MAGMVRRAMIYLGLVDDDYEDYEPYEEQQQQQPVATQRVRAQAQEMGEPPGVSSSIRTIPREPQAAPADTYAGVGNVRPAVVRPIQPVHNAKPSVVQPAAFSDAQEIGDRLKGNLPVIVNLQAADRELARRMIDFCSGATYALGGSMEKVADQVFLLTPSNVEVSQEERRRLSERGFRG